MVLEGDMVVSNRSEYGRAIKKRIKLKIFIYVSPAIFNNTMDEKYLYIL